MSHIKTIFIKFPYTKFHQNLTMGLSTYCARDYAGSKSSHNVENKRKIPPCW